MTSTLPADRGPHLRRLAATLLLLAALLPPASVRGQARRKLAWGPARGAAERFATSSPREMKAEERSRAPRDSEPPLALPELEIPSAPDRDNRIAPSAPPGANERDDPARSSERPKRAGPKTMAVRTGFPGLSNTGVTPPDPILAAGPDHLLAAVNSSFAIYTKAGEKVFQTTASAWFLRQLQALPSAHLFIYDPQVAYDHFGGRWILLYSATDGRTQSWVLLSVSASSDPTQAWHSWTLRGDVNGAAPASNFSDYPALGFDEKAIYLATNQYRYADWEFEYAKVRVLDKEPLYAGAAQAVWSDFWGLEDPASPGTRVHSVRPAQTFGSPGVEYLVSNSPFATRTFVTLWKLEGAATPSPALSGADVPVTATVSPPRANQRGGSPGTSGCPTPCLIDTGSGSIASAVYRNGSLWFAHTVADGGGTYSRARYGRINVAARSLVEDEAFGSEGCWSFFPALSVDDGNDLTMVFGRTCDDEYAGIRLTGRALADAALEPSVSVRDGDGSYVVPIGDGPPVNRWGDFFGAALDPVVPGSVWVTGEFAGLHNAWGTWIAEAALTPAGGSCLPDASTLCLGNGRFRVSATWSKSDGSTGAGMAAPITDDTGYFWFFDPANIEVVLKALDGCGVNGRRWVFAGGLTNVAVSLTVTDTASGAVAAYSNPSGTPFAPLQDTSAFPCP